MLGIIDSGKGGVYFAEEFKLNNYIVISDNEYFPYGTKSKTFLILRTIYLCEYLFEFCDKILLACNTLSIVALPFLKTKYKDKIEGVIDLLLPYSNMNTFFLGTTNTIKYLKEIHYEFACLQCDELIKKIQENDKVEECIKLLENSIPKDFSLLLGCTHLIGIKDKFNHKVILPKYEK